VIWRNLLLDDGSGHRVPPLRQEDYHEDVDTSIAQTRGGWCDVDHRTMLTRRIFDNTEIPRGSGPVIDRSAGRR
jgi:hypothetical protein